MKLSAGRIHRSKMAAIAVVALWSLVQLRTGGPREASAQQIIPILGFNFTLQTYFDVSSSFAKSQSGYGGAGLSGGDGDALLRIVNVGNFDALPTGFLCANIYVFDDAQEIQECCSCPVSPDGELTLSTINNLTSNPLISGAKLSLGTIKVIGSSAPPSDCVGAVEAGSGAHNGSDGLKVWLNHAETIASNRPPSFSFVTSTSVTEATSVPLDEVEAAVLISVCNFAEVEGSGHGICNCGTGENLTAIPSSSMPSPQSVNPRPFTRR